MNRTILLAVALFGLVLLLHSAEAPAQIYFPRVPYPRPYPPPPRPGPDPNQDPDSSPVEVGSYLAIGGGKESVVVGGIYGQWNRPGLCPGLDLRIQGNPSSLHGALVGPRLAYKPSGDLHGFHPYVEVLFGPNEYPRLPTTFDPNPPSYRGVTTAAVIGLDGDLGTHFRLRIFEYARETFTGLSGAQPYTVTTGIVLHLP